MQGKGMDLSELSEADGEGDPAGLRYPEYLGILLSLTGREKRIMRSLDAVEGVIREVSGRQFYLDQCVDAFRIRVICGNGQEYTAERQFCYEW